MQKEQDSPMQRSQLVVSDSRRESQDQVRESRIDKVYQECDTYAEVTASVRKTFREKGITSLLHFAVDLKVTIFLTKSTDISHTHKINKQKLKQKLSFLSDRALDLIIGEFAPTGSNEINYAELIYSLKGQLEPQQEDVIGRSFTLLDANN